MGRVNSRTHPLTVAHALVTLALCGACGGGSTKPSQAAPNTSASDAGGAVTASTSEPKSAAPVETKPFAKTGAEASSMIDDAIEKRHDAVNACVQDARKRRNDPHAKVEFDIGIDQEGVLMGVKAPKGGKDDATLNECVRVALRGALFPRSNAGVLTVRKTFVDAVVYPK